MNRNDDDAEAQPSNGKRGDVGGGIDPDELLVRWARAEFERAIRSNPGREDEVREAFRRAAEPDLPEALATLAEIVASSTDPEDSAKAAELLAELSSKHGGGTEA